MWLLQAAEPTSLLEWFGIGGGSTGMLAVFYWLARRLLNRLLTSVDDLAGSVKEAHESVGHLTHALELQGVVTGKEIAAIKEESAATRTEMREGFAKVEKKLDHGAKEFRKVGEGLVACRKDIEHNKTNIKRISDRVKKRGSDG